MWETQEEVRSAMLELKMFDTMEVVGQAAEGEEEEEESDECSPQVFAEHIELEERFTRSMYYGAMPATDRPSLPLTRIAVDQFTSAGLDALGAKLGRLDMARAADMTRQACAGPNSLVLALLYLDRLRRRNPDYLTTVSSADLFLVSLMVASKFLHDDGEEDEVFNDEWASSGGMDTKDLNRLEVAFLAAMDWRIFVDETEFSATVRRLETDVARAEVAARGGATYSDLSVLGSGELAAHMLTLLAQAAVKVTAVCLTTYAAGLLTLLGTAAALSRTPLGPAQVATSVRTLATAFAGEEQEQVVAEEREDGRNLSSADLVAASLLVATLTSAPLTDAMEDAAPGLDSEELRQEMNRSRAAWLAEAAGGAAGRGGGGFALGGDRDYTMAPRYHDRPDTGTAWLPLPPLLPATYPGYSGRCPVLRWGAAALPALLTPG